MKTLSIDDPRFLGRNARPSMLDRLARRIVLGKLAALEKGRVTVCERGRETAYGDSRDESGLSATITVNSPAFYSRCCFWRFDRCG